MTIREEEKVVKTKISVFVADDGKEFTSKYECEKYEEKQKKNKAVEQAETLRVSSLDDLMPITTDGLANENNTFRWYRLENEKDFKVVNNAYAGTLGKPSAYPEMMCVETCGYEAYMDDAYSYDMATCRATTEEFWKKLGYKVTFEPMTNNTDEHLLVYAKEVNGLERKVLKSLVYNFPNWQDMAGKIKSHTDDLGVGSIVKCNLTDGTQTFFVVTEVTDLHVRFETLDCIGEKVCWNNEGTNRGGYPDSDIRKYVDSVIWNLLPEDLQAVISDVDREWIDKDGNCGTYTTKLFLPAASEVFNEYDCCGDKGLYEQLEYYMSGRNRIRLDKNGNSCTWWLASVRHNESTHACGAHVYGAPWNMRTFSKSHVPVCFQISRIS